MGGVNRQPSHSPARRSGSGLFGLSPALTGTACCVVSALGYTGANICMRALADHSHALPEHQRLSWAMWVIFNKELVTVAVVGPWLLCRAFRRLPLLSSRRALAALILVGLAVQLGANVPVQWALEKVGLAIVVPVIFGVMLMASAVLGFFFLKERLARRSTLAIGLLVAAVAILGMAAKEAGKPTDVGSFRLLALGVGAACLAGAIYACLTTTIRHVVTRAMPPSVIVFTTTVMAVLSLGPLCVSRLGTEQLLSTTGPQLAWMYAAGILNLIAFLAITKGLQLTTVVHVSVLNASQVAMAAVAGLVWFGEPATGWLTAGVIATIVGVMIYRPPFESELPADQHV